MTYYGTNAQSALNKMEGKKMYKKYSKPEIEVFTSDVKLDVITASGTGNSVDVKASGGFEKGDIWG